MQRITAFQDSMLLVATNEKIGFGWDIAKILSLAISKRDAKKMGTPGYSSNWMKILR